MLIRSFPGYADRKKAKLCGDFRTEWCLKDRLRASRGGERCRFFENQESDFLRDTAMKPNNAEPIKPKVAGTGTGVVVVNSLNCPSHFVGPVKFKRKLCRLANTAGLVKSLKLTK